MSDDEHAIENLRPILRVEGLDLRVAYYVEALMDCPNLAANVR